MLKSIIFAVAEATRYAGYTFMNPNIDCFHISKFNNLTKRKFPENTKLLKIFVRLIKYML